MRFGLAWRSAVGSSHHARVSPFFPGLNDRKIAVGMEPGVDNIKFSGCFFLNLCSPVLINNGFSVCRFDNPEMSHETVLLKELHVSGGISGFINAIHLTRKQVSVIVNGRQRSRQVSVGWGMPSYQDFHPSYSLLDLLEFLLGCFGGRVEPCGNLLPFRQAQADK